MSIKIALAGNPNCGKTTLFNELTGSNQYVGNWPGVTVEKKEGKLKGHKEVVIQDLPGIYSLSPYSLEEVVSRNYLVTEKPDAILNIIDGTNIERNLYLSTQLVELGIPMTIAVNMADLIEKNGDRVDTGALAKAFGCTVLEMSALKKDGCRAVAERTMEVAQKAKPRSVPAVFTGSVAAAIAEIETALRGKVDDKSIRWFAVKVFERDQKVIEQLKLDKAFLDAIEKKIAACEEELDDDAESIITSQRYEYIKKVVESAVVKKRKSSDLSFSDRIDKVVTSRLLGLPIFFAVIWFMYYVSVQTLGGWLTDWANDGVFGDGWHLAYTVDNVVSPEVEARNAEIAKEAVAVEARNAEKRQNAKEGEEPELEEVPEPETWEGVSGEFADAQKRIAAWGNAAVAAGAAKWEPAEEEEEATDKEAAKTAEATAAKPADTVEKAEEEEAPEVNEENVGEFKLVITDEAKAKTVKSEKIFFEDDESGEIDHEEEVDYEAYLAATKVQEPDPADYGVWIPGVPKLLDSAMAKVGVNETVKRLVNEVLLGGVGTVLGFVPQIIIVFLFLAFLEDCGYMARIAFIMDRIFRKFGLSGKSFIPMIVGMGCGVPAVMATRTIESQRDRRMTITLGTYIPCGAKYAIIAMFTTAFFNGSAWVAASMYILGVAVIILGGIALKKTKPFLGDPAPFVMELPAYHMPTLSGVLIRTWERTKAYMIKAGTIIFAACTVLWLLMNLDWSFPFVELEQSMLHDIGNTFAWLFAPLGFGEWKGAVAVVTSEIAKEEAVATLAMLSPDVVGGTAKGIHALFEGFGPEGLAGLAGLSFMIMNLFDPPCLVAIATTFREMGTARWGWFAVGLQFLIGYCLALVTYQIGKLILLGSFGVGTIFALLVLLAMLYFIFRPTPKLKA